MRTCIPTIAYPSDETFIPPAPLVDPELQSSVTSLVGFVGAKRSGKDTAARALMTQGWRRMAFADALKKMSLKLRGVWVEVPEEAHLDSAITAVGGFAQYHEVVDALGMEKAKDLVPDVRTLLQTLGTDCVRGTIGETAWTDLIEDRVRESLLRYDEPVVLTDVRFDEEFDLVRRLGGMNIGVWRGSLQSFNEAMERLWLDGDGFVTEGDDGSIIEHDADNHISEANTLRLLGWCDAVICNTGTVEGLHAAVLQAVGL